MESTLCIKLPSRTVLLKQKVRIVAPEDAGKDPVLIIKTDITKKEPAKEEEKKDG